MTVYYPLETPVEEPWTQTNYCPDNTCNNLFDKDQEYLHGYVDTYSGSFKKATGSSDVQRSFRIPCSPNTTYVLSGMTANSGWGSFTSDAVGTVATRYVTGNGTITTGANDRYLIGMAYAIGTQYDYRATLKVEQGETATEYCMPMGPIKIATTKYNAARFDPLVTTLNTAIAKIKDVVATTSEQTKAVASLQANKQRRPNDNEECPAGKKCLLVEDNNGIPHWYEIVESYNPTLPAGFTELAYIESTGTQYIDTGYKPNTNTTIKTKTYMTANANTPFGCRWSGAPEYDTFGTIIGSTGQLTVYFGRYSDGKYTAYLSYDKSIVHDIEINMDSVVYDGSSTPITRGSFASTENMYLGAFNNIGEATNKITGRIYSIEIKESNIMVRDLVPARRESDGVLGMYDLADPNPATAFHTNRGTGTFTAGDVAQ